MLNVKLTGKPMARFEVDVVSLIKAALSKIATNFSAKELHNRIGWSDSNFLSLLDRLLTHNKEFFAIIIVFFRWCDLFACCPKKFCNQINLQSLVSQEWKQEKNGVFEGS